MKKIKILLTFDYELPLGGATNYHTALFEPTQKIFDQVRVSGVPIVLFADIWSAIRFKEWDLEGYYIPFCRQLQFAAMHGHDVQLHLHPHWANSTYANGRFVPSPFYSLSSFKDGVSGFSIERLITEGHQALEQICREVKNDYQCIAFRAGGYDVEPESKRILNQLYALGVRIDSSVIKGLRLTYEYSRIDYSHVPPASYWNLSKDGPLNRIGPGDLLELPISSMPVTLGDVLVRRVAKTWNRKTYRSRRYQNTGRGFLLNFGSRRIGSVLRSALNPLSITFDKEYVGYRELRAVVKYQLKKYDWENRDLFLTAIAHPKSMGSYHVALMREFIDRMREEFGDRVEFTTYEGIRRDFYL
jgi:hypothetical protein